jgi:hypothetical protein
MSDQQPQYRPDTLVSGHVLTEDAAERTRMSGVAELRIILRFLLLVGSRRPDGS